MITTLTISPTTITTNVWPPQSFLPPLSYHRHYHCHHCLVIATLTVATLKLMLHGAASWLQGQLRRTSSLGIIMQASSSQGAGGCPDDGSEEGASS
eukprot:15449823-Alexandrium_andersonii.AAC.1